MGSNKGQIRGRDVLLRLSVVAICQDLWSSQLSGPRCVNHHWLTPPLRPSRDRLLCHLGPSHPWAETTLCTLAQCWLHQSVECQASGVLVLQSSTSKARWPARRYTKYCPWLCGLLVGVGIMGRFLYAATQPGSRSTSEAERLRVAWACWAWHPFIGPCDRDNGRLSKVAIQRSTRQPR